MKQYFEEHWTAKHFFVTEAILWALAALPFFIC